MPVYADVRNPFDYKDATQVKKIINNITTNSNDKKRILADLEFNNLETLEKDIASGYFSVIEHPVVQNIIKNLGHDSFYVSEGLKSKNLGVYNPTGKIKSAIGNRGTFDPTNPDITKARGGKINPIKSPREMLFEMAGVPSMAGGGKLGAEMYRLITQAIERYTKTYGRPPSPEDVKALREHVRELSARPEIKSDPVTQARARHEMATDPNMINPEGPDPFLVKQTTGRTVKGTYLKPKVQDINDPQVRQNIETKQAAGALEDILPESATPASDYMARMGTSIENTALASGKTPMIDKIKAAFFAKNKRYPTDEELEILIAEFNPARHQYGPQGASIVAERPPTASGMAEWKQRARMEGIPEAFLEKSPRDYPKYLMDELNISRGIQPGAKPLPDKPINPDRPFADGGSTSMSPREMEADMVARGRTPKRLRGYEQSWKTIKDFLQGMRNAPAETMGEYASMLGYEPDRLQETEMRAPTGKLIPFPGQGSAAYETGKGITQLVADPINALFVGPTGKIAKKAITTPLQAARKNPIKTTIGLGAIPSVSIGQDFQPTDGYRSVMEGYK